MSAVVMIAPKLGTKGASRAAIAERSRREPNTLILVSTRNMLARGGTLETLQPHQFRIIAALAAGPDGFRTHQDLDAVVCGDGEDGGPTAPRSVVKVVISRLRESLDALSISVETDLGKGRRLVLTPITHRHAPTAIAFRVGNPSKAHWVERARAMRERGATYKAIGEAVGRAATTVSQALQGARSRPNRSRSPATPEALRRSRDRREARREAKRTGEPVEAIYDRWGCQAIDRSRLWDERRSASTTPEAH